jgi:hypothetical protein
VKRRLAWIAAVLVAGLAALALRVVLEGRAALAEGDEAMAEQRAADAITAWEAAARWYLPFASHVDEAYDRLREVARTHKSAAAWRSIRAAARATRGLWQPHAEELAEADAALLALATADPDRAPVGGDPPKFAAWFGEQLANDRRPSSGSAALAIAGIAAWLVGIALAIRGRSLANPGPASSPSWRYAAISAGGLAAWALGVYTA